MRVALVTDSAANVPPAEVERHGIEIVPLYLKLGEEVHQDGVGIPLDAFYRRLVDEKVPASTAGPPANDFREAYERALARADALVCVTVASFVSVTHASALNAAKELGDRVRVVDSKNASMAEGFCVLEAARLAAGGAGVDDVERRAREMAERVQLVATINTFEYLKRSGRVNALLAFAGTALNIKPAFAFRGGKVEQLGRARSRARAVDRLVEEVRAGARGPVHLAVVHAACAAEAAGLHERLAGELSPVEAHLADFTPVMGAHTGPGLLGICFWSEEH